MISIRPPSSAFDAVRAYDRNGIRMSGFQGVMYLLSHCILEIKYERNYRKKAEWRNEPLVYKTVLGAIRPLNRNKRIRISESNKHQAVIPDSNWAGARKRRMLVTRDFNMLKTWGGMLFGNASSSVSVFGGVGINNMGNTLYVWDCLFKDWRLLDISSPISVTAIIPTSLYPGCSKGISPRQSRHTMDLLDIQKRVSYNILESFYNSLGSSFYSYLNSGKYIPIQELEEQLRKAEFSRYNNRILNERKKNKAERDRKFQEEAERKRKEEERIEMENYKRQKSEKDSNDINDSSIDNADVNLEDKVDISDNAVNNQSVEDINMNKLDKDNDISNSNDISTNKVEMIYDSVTNSMVPASDAILNQDDTENKK